MQSLSYFLKIPKLYDIHFLTSSWHWVPSKRSYLLHISIACFLIVPRNLVLIFYQKLILVHFLLVLMKVSIPMQVALSYYNLQFTLNI